MDHQNLRDRTFRFALAVIAFCRRLPTEWEARRIASQLFDSGTSVAANYRAACRGRSRAEFIAKLGIVIEEADESELWLAILEGSGISKGPALQALATEAAELRAIFIASRNTARANKRSR
jgi:four helix bundle protein